MIGFLTQTAIAAVERGWAPDAVTRFGIRRLLAQRLAHESTGDEDEREARRAAFADSLRSGPIAVHAATANVQHYEVPAEFFGRALGPHRKYSCCLWEPGTETLADAERAALDVTCERAGLADGQRILELGCGWGSLSLRMAERHPSSRIVAVSNSASQKAYVAARAIECGLSNLRIVTADMNAFETDERFDRVVSVEMFEHMRNYERLLGRIATWLAPQGRLFVHVFCHRDVGYPFEAESETDWMATHFFTGGVMPCADLFERFPRVMRVVDRWAWDGRHYERTANAWLANLDAARDDALPILSRVYGADQAMRWLQRWRVFFMACAELFGYRSGREWFVTHALLERSGSTT